MKSKVSILFGIGLGSLMTYGYQILVARILGPVNYGLMAAILAIVSVIGTIAAGVSPISAKSSRKVSGLPNSWKFKSDKLYRSTLLLSLIGGLLLALISVTAGQRLRLGVLPLVFVAGYVPIAFLFAIAIGRMQSLHRNLQLTWFSTFSAGLRFLTLVPMALLSLGVTGGTFLFLASSLVSLGIGIYLTRNIYSGEEVIWSKKSIATLVVFGSFWSFTNSDVVAIKVLSGDHEAGTYAASVSIGRILVVLTTIWVQYKFASYLRHLEEPQMPHVRFVIGSILPVLCIGILTTLIFSFFSMHLIHAIYGVEFIDSAGYVVKQALVAIVISINYILVNILVIEGSIALVPAIVMTWVATLVAYQLTPLTLASKFETFFLANVVLLGILGVFQIRKSNS